MYSMNVVPMQIFIEHEDRKVVKGTKIDKVFSRQRIPGLYKVSDCYVYFKKVPSFTIAMMKMMKVMMK
jgi:hypothetical protein